MNMIVSFKLLFEISDPLHVGIYKVDFKKTQAYFHGNVKIICALNAT